MRILVYSPVPPSHMSSGALMLYQLLSLDKENDFFCFCAVDPLRKIPVESPGENVHVMTMRRPIENAIRLTGGFVGESVAYAFEVIKELYTNKVVIPQVIKYGQRNKIDCIWAILQGKTVISSVLELSLRLDVPLKCQIWDEPNWILKDTNIDRKSFRKTMFRFKKALSKSDSIACASFAMQEQYEKYNKPTSVFLGSMEGLSRSVYKKNKFFYIGFAGQIYAKEEWNCLIKAMDSLGWKAGGQNIKIKVLGKFDKKFAMGLPIEILGYRSQEDVLKILSAVDLNYCPYWFDAEHKNIAETSFPSKLTTYLACNRPVIVHAPEYSSPVKFLRSNRCGFVCNTLDYKKLAKAIQTIARGNYDRSILQNQTVAFKKYLTFEYQRKQMKNFLKLDQL